MANPLNADFVMAKKIAGISIFVGLMTLWGTALASSAAGIALRVRNIEVLVTYSVALEYDGANDCIRNPECLLFDVIALLQNNDVKMRSDETLLFDLHQSSNEEGNWLSLVRNPYEGSAPYKKLYDGKAKPDLSAQIVGLLAKELQSSPTARKITAVTLFRCVNKKRCNDIRFGSFPSEGEHTGYCISAGDGCSSKPIAVSRSEMKKYFSELPE